ncbi:hypothetical protein ACH4HG_22300 [Streptomyces coeruleorubidus]|uniref:Uncharacterized protein n=1 Tax=Streptomyces coeruleorubidus TaxID=116188 RepID=A0ABZ0KMH4_STRC4|nr:MULTISPECIES: hypothetical protein [Streptomyces]WOT38797.1 hypothetical protein R5U08_33650 [Streptomyces coeruleorubidus]
MPHDSQLIFADHVGRFYARQYGFLPMAGRLWDTCLFVIRLSRRSMS